MANSIALVTKYQPIVDEVYKEATLTGDLESGAVQFDGSQTVKVLKVSVPDLGDYSRNSGFTAGDVTATWESWQLTQDRGKEFSIDSMDNEETLDQTFGAAASAFIKQKVVPEIDAYRFAKLASKSGVSANAVAGALAANTIIEAIDAAEAELSEDEVPVDGRILYITPTNYQLLKQALATKAGLSRIIGASVDQNFETFDGMKVVLVPQSRFATTFSKGKNNEGYTLSGNNINFMIVHPSAVEAVAKHVKLRIFTPDINQSMDAYKFQYRIYHDAFVYDNKVAGIYVSKGAAIQSGS